MDLSISNTHVEDTESVNSPVSKPFTNNSPGVQILKALINKTLRIEMSDGRVLIGIFLCTDADANVILGSCSEYLPHELKPNKNNEDPRMLGLVMVPGKHIITISKDLNDPPPSNVLEPQSIDFQEDMI